MIMLESHFIIIVREIEFEILLINQAFSMGDNTSES